MVAQIIFLKLSRCPRWLNFLDPLQQVEWLPGIHVFACTMDSERLKVVYLEKLKSKQLISRKDSKQIENITIKCNLNVDCLHNCVSITLEYLI